MTNNQLEETIASHGEALGSKDPAPSDLESRIAKVESLIEQVGQYSALVSELNLYVSDCRAEITSIRKIRIGALVCAVFFCIFCLAFSVCIIFFKPFSLTMLASQFMTYSLITLIASTVIILSVVLKGAFRTIADRHGDESLPPHIKEAMDAIKPLKDAIPK